MIQIKILFTFDECCLEPGWPSFQTGPLFFHLFLYFIFFNFYLAWPVPALIELQSALSLPLKTGSPNRYCIQGLLTSASALTCTIPLLPLFLSLNSATPPLSLSFSPTSTAPSISYFSSRLSHICSLLKSRRITQAKSLLLLLSSYSPILLSSLLTRPHPTPPSRLRDLALTFFSLMKTRNLAPSLLTFNNFLLSLSSSLPLSLSDSRSLLSDMRSLSLSNPPSTYSYNLLITASCNRSRLSSALSLFKDMPTFSLYPDTVTYNSLIHAFCKRGFLMETEIPPNRITYTTIVAGYCKLGRVKEAVKLVDLMSQSNQVLPDNWTYNALLSGLYDMMGKLRTPPDAVTYNTIISSCFCWGQSNRALEVFKEMVSKGVAPNSVTYNILVNGLCKDGKLDSAKALLKKMVGDGFLPDSVSYNTPIDGYCKSGGLIEAFKLLDEMVSKGLRMDTFTFNTLLNCLCDEKRVDDAYGLPVASHEKGFFADEVSYGTVMKNEIFPSVSTFNSIIKCLCKLGRTKRGLVPDGTTYNTLIHGFCREGRLEEAFLFHNQVVEKFFKPDVITCNILIHGLCNRRMVGKGKTVDAITYNILIRGLCYEGRIEDAIKLFEEMREKKLGPDKFSYNAILRGLSRAGRKEEAENLLRKMIESGVLPDQITYTVLGKSHSKESKHDSQCLDEESESKFYINNIKKFCSEGRFEEAKYVMEEMVHKGLSIPSSTYVDLIDGFINKQNRIVEDGYKMALCD
ncbi:hypothetical protein AMTRI_Chr09g40440 [Amborella trichopoda]